MRYSLVALLISVTLGGVAIEAAVDGEPPVTAQAATAFQGTIGDGVQWSLKDGPFSGYSLHLSGGTLPDNSVDMAQILARDTTNNPLKDTDNPWIARIIGQTTDIQPQVIRTIVFDGTVKTGRNAQYLFGGLQNLLKIDHLERLDTSQATTMTGMFYMDGRLGQDLEDYSLDLSHFNTSHATDMSYMFDGLQNLKQLNVATLDTRQVTTMNHMFAGMQELKTIDVSHFNTNHVTDMADMFSNCGYIHNSIVLDVAKFDTSHVTNMAGMFLRIGATNLDLKNFDTSHVLDMSHMFQDSSELTTLDVTGFRTSGVTNMAEMFRGLSITTLSLRRFNTAKVTNMNHMFADDTHLTKLDLKSFQTDLVTDMGGMFSNDSALTTLDIQSFRTGRVINMADMFIGDGGLTNLDVSRFDTRQVLNMRSMFAGMTGLSQLDLHNFETPKVVWMGMMFWDMEKLKKLNLSPKFQTGNVTDMMGMFMQDGQLNDVDVSHFDTRKVISVQSMFIMDAKLTRLNLANWNLQGPRQIDEQMQKRLWSMVEQITDIEPDSSATRVHEFGMFYGTNQLAQLTLGSHTWLNADDPSNFEENLDNTNPMLGNPPVSTAYTGKWQAVGKGTPANPQGPDSLTSSELVTRYGGATQPAGSVTYVWQPTDDHRPTLPVDPGTPVDPEKPVDPGTPVDPTPDPGTPTPIVPPVKPTPEVPVNASINAVRKVGLYRKPTFTAANRVTWYAKRPRTRQPQFVVTGKATSRNGVARYKVRDVNRHSRTYRLTGYVTTRAAYVQPTYYARTQAKTITVLNPRGVNGYRRANLTGKIVHYRQGQSLRVKRLVTHNLTTRFQLTNGQYVTANRQLVQTGRHTMPRRITAKRSLYRYRDVNFRRRVSHVKPGQTLTVLGWDYSDHGTLRYRVAGGYVTANRQFIR